MSKISKQERDKRLAEALKRNLSRRKQAARDKPSDGGTQKGTKPSKA